MNFKTHRLGLIIALLLSTVGCDQVTKVLARDLLKTSSPISYLKGMIVFQHSQNPGAFLSLGADLHSGMRFWIFTVAVTLLLTAVLVMLIRAKKLGKIETLALTLVVGGGIGNLIDRIAQGSVTDFIHMGIGPLRTGIFNIADVAITAGVILFFLTTFKKQTDSKEPA